jgi:hypothetical protein
MLLLLRHDSVREARQPIQDRCPLDVRNAG